MFACDGSYQSSLVSWLVVLQKQTMMGSEDMEESLSVLLKWNVSWEECQSTMRFHWVSYMLDTYEPYIIHNPLV